MNLQLLCDYCGKPFDTWKAWAEKHTNHYCGKDCKNNHHAILYGSGESKSDYFKRYYVANKEKKCAQAKTRADARKPEKREYDNRRRKENGAALNDLRRSRQYDFTPQLTKRLLSAARQRAVKFNVPFDLELSDITIPIFCPALGIELNWNVGRSQDDSPSLDKFIPSLGYVKGNIAVISWRANKIKSDATADEVQKVATWMKSIINT